MRTTRSFVKTLCRLLAPAFVTITLSLALSLPISAQNDDAARAAAIFNSGRVLDAYPLYEKLAAAQPTDARIHYNYAFCLLAKANNSIDADEKRQVRIKARQEFETSKKLGITEPNIDGLLSSMPSDGVYNDNGFSFNKQANDYMNQAEGKFGAGDWDGAFDLYQKALKIDPQLYEAALFSGDVMTQKVKYADAENWYMAATRINPFRETAYRYSATPLMKQQKYEEAKMRYIEAYITEPYNRFASGGLIQWANAVGKNVGHPKIDVPASVGTGADGNTTITVSPSAGVEDGSAAWASYGLARALWVSGKDGKLSDKFQKAYPKETTYRHSLAEEYDGLKTVVTVVKEMIARKDSKITKLDPSIAKLVEMSDKGLLESFILLARADQGIAKDHLGYLSQNRPKLRQYVVEYVIPQ